jgi:actin-related protein
MLRGQVTDWDMMSELWNHVFFEKLKDEVKPDEEAVLITECILNPKGNREKAAEILFETFNIPAI